MTRKAKKRRLPIPALLPVDISQTASATECTGVLPALTDDEAPEKKD